MSDDAKSNIAEMVKAEVSKRLSQYKIKIAPLLWELPRLTSSFV